MPESNEHGVLVFSGALNKPWFVMEVSNAEGSPLVKGEAVVFKPGQSDVALVGKEFGNNSTPSVAEFRVAGIVWPNTIASSARGYIVGGGLIDGVKANGPFARGNWLHLSSTHLGKLQKTTDVIALTNDPSRGAFAICQSLNTLSQAVEITALILPWRL